MRQKDIVLAAVAILLMMWLGGHALGMLHHFVNTLIFTGIRVAALVAVVAIIIHLASARRV